MLYVEDCPVFPPAVAVTHTVPPHRVCTLHTRVMELVVLDDDVIVRLVGSTSSQSSHPSLVQGMASDAQSEESAGQPIPGKSDMGMIPESDSGSS